MFKHQEEEKDGEEERSQSPTKKRRMENRRYPRILLDHEQVPHSLDFRNRASVENSVKAVLWKFISPLFLLYMCHKCCLNCHVN
jgi:hypothetical protein